MKVTDLDEMRKLSTMAERLYGNKDDARQAAMDIMERRENPLSAEEEREQFIQDEMAEGHTRWEAMAVWNTYEEDSTLSD